MSWNREPTGLSALLQLQELLLKLLQLDLRLKLARARQQMKADEDAQQSVD